MFLGKKFSRIIFISFMLAATLSSCRLNAQSAPALTETPTLTVTISKTPLSSFTSTPLRSASVTPTFSASIAEVEEALSGDFYDPKDPTLPELIILGDDGLRLIPDWKTTKIEYQYSWGGLGKPQLGYEIIQQKGEGYRWNDKEIPTQKIDEFLSSITHLYEVPSLLIGLFHTDDYPGWVLDLTGADGKHLLLYAASNQNPGFGPWHVVYNGRIYAQYDGSIGPAVAALFDGAGDNFFNWQGSDYHESNRVGFGTSRWPHQLFGGFTGLLPVSDNFHYKVNLKEKEIQGSLPDSYAIDYTEQVIFKKIDRVFSVELLENNKAIPCHIQKIKNEDGYIEEWKFSCKFDDVKADQRYLYPITIVYHTDDYEKLTTSGELQGIWHDSPITRLMPPVGDFKSAIEHNLELKDLLVDHIFYNIQYFGEIKLGVDKKPILLGEMTLLGQTKVNDSDLTYIITTPFAMMNGEFVEWDLTRSKLQSFIADVFKSPLTKRIYQQFPETTLNLWYAEKAKPDGFPEVYEPFMSSLEMTDFKVDLPACGEIPALAFPAHLKPLRGFGFNVSGRFSLVTSFVLTDDGVVPYRISISPEQDDPKLMPYLVPKGFDVNGRIPFIGISYPGFFEAHTLHMTPSDILQADANSIADALPFDVDKKYNSWWELPDVGVKVDDDGALSLISCSAK